MKWVMAAILEKIMVMRGEDGDDVPGDTTKDTALADGRFSLLTLICKIG